MASPPGRYADISVHTQMTECCSRLWCVVYWDSREKLCDMCSMPTQVAGTFTLDTIYQCFVCHFVWHYCILKWGLDTPAVWSSNALLVPAQLIAFIVQCFYTRQIWVLGKHKLAIVLTNGAALEMALSTAFTIGSFMTPILFVDSNHDNDHNTLLFITNVLVLCTIVVTMITDIGIAITMCRLLYEQRSSQMMETTRSVVNMLLHHSMATGLLLTVSNAAYAVVAVALPHDLLYIAIYLSASQLYINSMLAVLNNREALRARLDTAQGTH
ncbi:hypothetical protein NEOLEDRAFT_1136303 [Neolentinus lepideus HHB14362 ss-1]|uniref:DUF6534 domain-containing protein n=1 Tax=Neolentinus lepideus HHB14362 ss-1 TaxID=1314782 RepID=A0A165RA92_9AGAM|nr:hypothetical protein NEOLEDRAFT_1136303 [Neolentinus lepideus HHB14362 ss-1]